MGAAHCDVVMREHAHLGHCVVCAIVMGSLLKDMLNEAIAVLVRV